MLECLAFLFRSDAVKKKSEQVKILHQANDDANVCVTGVLFWCFFLCL